MRNLQLHEVLENGTTVVVPLTLHLPHVVDLSILAGYDVVMRTAAGTTHRGKLMQRPDGLFTFHVKPSGIWLVDGCKIVLTTNGPMRDYAGHIVWAQRSMFTELTGVMSVSRFQLGPPQLDDIRITWSWQPTLLQRGWEIYHYTTPGVWRLCNDLQFDGPIYPEWVYSGIRTAAATLLPDGEESLLYVRLERFKEL